MPTQSILRIWSGPPAGWGRTRYAFSGRLFDRRPAVRMASRTRLVPGDGELALGGDGAEDVIRLALRAVDQADRDLDTAPSVRVPPAWAVRSWAIFSLDLVEGQAGDVDVAEEAQVDVAVGLDGQGRDGEVGGRRAGPRSPARRGARRRKGAARPSGARAAGCSRSRRVAGSSWWRARCPGPSSRRARRPAYAEDEQAANSADGPKASLRSSANTLSVFGVGETGRSVPGPEPRFGSRSVSRSAGPTVADLSDETRD